MKVVQDPDANKDAITPTQNDHTVIGKSNQLRVNTPINRDSVDDRSS